MAQKITQMTPYNKICNKTKSQKMNMYYILFYTL